jgi:hypothetical protein
MIVKLMTGNGGWRLYECSHVTQSRLPDRTEVELSSGERFSLPRDGEIAYVVEGKITVDAIKPPIEPKKERQTA